METENRPCWFVGATYDGTEDQLPRFLTEGLWENGYEDKHLDVVRSMRSGDRIAIKAAYTRKNGLSFDNRGQTVSVMAIKAIGTITENLNDGKRVRVNWTKVEPVREWYFYTHRGTVWRVLPGEWMTDGLIAFAFDGIPQDIDRFCNAPYWHERFGTGTPDKRRFGWTKFYELIADKLLMYRNNRAALLEGIRDISLRVEGLGHLAEDQYAGGNTGFVKDICPFTTMGLFNRGIKDSNRKIIAAELAKFLGVEEPVPETFEGIPLLNNLKSWYFGFEKERPDDHIDALWNVFATGIKFADSGNDDTRAEFAKAFDNANGRRGVAWNLTFGLYWIRPWAFLSLDNNSQVYVTKKLGVPIGLHGPKKRCNSSDYLALMDVLEPRFQETSYPVHSYPELSLEAWLYRDGETLADGGDDDDEAESEQQPVYTIADCSRETGLNEETLVRWTRAIERKGQAVLYGPPGTGKTYVAWWLAKHLVDGSDGFVELVQFHPAYAYEDFMQGIRPKARESGGLDYPMVPGRFREFCKVAEQRKGCCVLILDEINRANLSRVFGKLMYLLEYRDHNIPLAGGERFGIPENVRLIGTMNTADRSIALVDHALRRRFAFLELSPNYEVLERFHSCNEFSVTGLVETLKSINRQIDDRHYMVGISFFLMDDLKDQIEDIWLMEIEPYLDEYFFDQPGNVDKFRWDKVKGTVIGT